MVAGRPGAGRQKEGALFSAAGEADAVSGFLLLFNHLFLPSLEREQERKFFVFCVPLVAAALGLLGQPLLPACPGGARKREKKRAPLSIGRTSRLSLRGNTAEESLQGIKHNPAVRRVKVKHQPDGLRALITRPIPASGQGKSLPGDTHAPTKKPGPIGNRKCALSGAAFGSGLLRTSLFTARQY